MSAYKQYSSIVTNINPTILGYRLLPFSLGMVVILKEAQSKFITGEYNSFLDINHVFNAFKCDSTLIAEFIFAVLVCSNSYDEIKEEFGNGDFIKEYRQLMGRLATYNDNILYEIHAFAHYIKNGTETVEYNVKEQDGIEASNPFEFESAVISSLMENTNYTRSECYNLPITETLTAYLMYAHKNGVIEIVSKELVELMKEMKEQRTANVTG